MGVEYPNYTGIPVRLCLCSSFWGFDHNVWVRSWIYGVPIASDVVGCIVYTQCPAMVNAFSCYADCIPLFIGEHTVRVTLVLSFKQAAKDVILQFWYKALLCFMSLDYTGAKYPKRRHTENVGLSRFART